LQYRRCLNGGGSAHKKGGSAAREGITVHRLCAFVIEEEGIRKKKKRKRELKGGILTWRENEKKGDFAR